MPLGLTQRVARHWWTPGVQQPHELPLGTTLPWDIYAACTHMLEFEPANFKGLSKQVACVSMLASISHVWLEHGHAKLDMWQQCLV